ncbi:hypothetical protein HY061_01060 [Candidatus Azambacteria bacterium]|nr:hypothetical protein [Candidatus Azambacteria bacterium]
MTERKGKGDFKINDWQQSGLLLQSWIRLSKIACLNKTDIKIKLGILSVPDRKNIILSWNRLYKF